MKRTTYIKKIKEMWQVMPAVALLGPRQVGKTTLARQLCGELPDFDYDSNYFDLDDPVDRSRLSNPKLALERLHGLVVIDEVQRKKDFFPVLRVLLDRPDNQMTLLILGSASRDLIQQSSETLAGRLGFIEVSPFSLEEFSAESVDLPTMWLGGGYPRSFLTDSPDRSFLWLQEYCRSFLERDIPLLGLKVPADTLGKFWQMLAHYHANTLNSSELGRSMGVADTTIKRYLDILTGTFMVRQLLPFHANIAKRQAKKPKIYFRDTGVLHHLLGVKNHSTLQRSPKLGASWEGFALEQVIQLCNASSDKCYFWGVHQQAELDLLVEKDGGFQAFEFKYTDKPKTTRSMQNFLLSAFMSLHLTARPMT
jgi:predicted AAA+ superfamily ATPase